RRRRRFGREGHRHPDGRACGRHGTGGVRDSRSRSYLVRGVPGGSHRDTSGRPQGLSFDPCSADRGCACSYIRLYRSVLAAKSLSCRCDNRRARRALPHLLDSSVEPNWRLVVIANRSLVVDSLHVGYGNCPVIHGVSLEFLPGKITVIVGANACGKSTLLRSMSRLLQPSEGHVLLDGKSIHQIPPRQLARSIGLLPQSPIAPDGITVSDLIGRGRHPHQGLVSRWSKADDEAVVAAMEATRTTDLAARPVDELSGGQRQRVWIAMALAQGTDLLLLDEPTTFLDVSHQIEVLDILTDLNRSRGTTIVMVLHDLNLAARYADQMVALCNGCMHLCGAPSEVLTEETVRTVFGMDSRIIADPLSGRPHMLPIGRHHAGG